jgi:hypothetical protein
LDKFEADCVITINTFPFTGTCKGDHIGAGATIVDTPGGGTALGTDSSNVPCILQTSSETLTTHDGSTITLKTDGITCDSVSAGRSIRPTGYQITGGTGRFAGATGAGSLVVSLAGATFNNSSHFLIHIDGNIQLPEDGDRDKD